MASKRKPEHRARYVSPKEASERLGVSTQTLRNWARAGKISFILLPSGRRHYNVDAIEQIMNARAEPEPVAAVARAPEAPRVELVVPPAIPAPVDSNPLALAIYRLVTERPADAQEQLMALLGAAGSDSSRHASKPAKKSVDLKAAIEAIAEKTVSLV